MDARPSRQLTVERNDYRAALVATQLDVTPLLAYLGEPHPFQRTDRLLPGDDRERWTHAGTSTAAIVGGSMPSGNGWSSK